MVVLVLLVILNLFQDLQEMVTLKDIGFALHHGSTGWFASERAELRARCKHLRTDSWRPNL